MPNSESDRNVRRILIVWRVIWCVLAAVAIAVIWTHIPDNTGTFTPHNTQTTGGPVGPHEDEPEGFTPW